VQTTPNPPTNWGPKWDKRDLLLAKGLICRCKGRVTYEKGLGKGAQRFERAGTCWK